FPLPILPNSLDGGAHTPNSCSSFCCACRTVTFSSVVDPRLSAMTHQSSLHLHALVQASSERVVAGCPKLRHTSHPAASKREPIKINEEVFSVVAAPAGHALSPRPKP
ncbi:hypothetical protein VIGAN_UM002000, partial [Vigna angularis var. angularis]